MIAVVKFDVLLNNKKDNFEMLAYEINESDDGIEVYSSFFNQNLQRGWVGDLTYHCYKGYVMHTDDEVEDYGLMTIKDVLLRNIQCHQASEHECTLWKYTFLKD
jgi:hypothetical protein